MRFTGFTLTLGLCVLLCFFSATLVLQGQPRPRDPNAQTYANICAGCHGTTITGGRAPTLFDDVWHFGGDDASIRQSIMEGRAGTEMPPFKSMFKEEEITGLIAYIRAQAEATKTSTARAQNPAGQILKTEKHAVKLEVVADKLEAPWGMAFLPDGRMIFTERAGRLRFLSRDGRMSAPVKGTPAVFVRQDGGMLDVALPPDYAQTGWIYLSYSTLLPGYQAQPGDESAPNLAPPTMTVIVRGKVNEKNEWVDQQTLFQADPEFYRNTADHYGSRFLFDGKGHVYWSMGERHDYQAAQNLATPLGKIHRINLDGSIPADNPFLHTPGAMPSIWTYGHRNPEGLAIDPVTGLFWETEHGPVGGDEVNIIEPGKNYGWGVVTMGIEPGIWRQRAAGMTPPVTFYNPSIGPSGITFYTGDKFPAWKNNLFVTGMVGQRLIRMEIDGRKITHQEILFQDFGRVRDVQTGPDGNLYALLQNQNGDPTGGSIIRLVPAR